MYAKIVARQIYNRNNKMLNFLDISKDLIEAVPF